jgi:hypothetical protein
MPFIDSTYASAKAAELSCAGITWCAKVKKNLPKESY